MGGEALDYRTQNNSRHFLTPPTFHPMLARPVVPHWHLCCRGQARKAQPAQQRTDGLPASGRNEGTTVIPPKTLTTNYRAKSKILCYAWRTLKAPASKSGEWCKSEIPIKLGGNT